VGKRKEVSAKLSKRSTGTKKTKKWVYQIGDQALGEPTPQKRNPDKRQAKLERQVPQGNLVKKRPGQTGPQKENGFRHSWDKKGCGKGV